MRFHISTEEKTITIHNDIPLKELRHLVESFAGNDWLEYTLINGNPNNKDFSHVNTARRLAGETGQPSRSYTDAEIWNYLTDRVKGAFKRKDE